MKLSNILTLVLYRNVLNTCYVSKETKEFSMKNEQKQWVAKLKYNPETKRIEFSR